MASSRTARPAWAAALALLCGCSSETTTEPVVPEPEEASYESENLAGTEELRDLSWEDIWAVGVEKRFASVQEVDVRKLEAEELRDLSREEIWGQGVQRLRWHPDDPPENWTKEMMLERFSVDTKYWGWVLRAPGYTEVRPTRSKASADRFFHSDPQDRDSWLA